MRSVVRRSCQTMALWIGWPDSASHRSVVSRWLVTPSAASSSAEMPASASAVWMTDLVLSQISVASCSTLPGSG